MSVLNTALSVSACCVTRIPNDAHSVTIVYFVDSKSPLSCDFIHLVVCLATGPEPLPKQALHIVWSRASSFKWENSLLCLRSSSSYLCLLRHLPVTSIPPFIFPSITRCRMQFLCKMWPIQLAFCLLISSRIFLCSLTLSNTSSFLTWSVQLILSSTTFQNSLGVSAAPYKAMLQMLHFIRFFLSLTSTVLVKLALFLLNAAFAISIQDLISQVHLPSLLTCYPNI